MYNYRSEIYAQYKIYLFYKGEVDLTITHLKSSAVECAKQICGFNIMISGGTKEEEEEEKKKKKKKKKKEKEEEEEEEEEEVECSIFLLDEGEWYVSRSGHFAPGE
jgi:hypothetical protein